MKLFLIKYKVPVLLMLLATIALIVFLVVYSTQDSKSVEQVIENNTSEEIVQGEEEIDEEVKQTEDSNPDLEVNPNNVNNESSRSYNFVNEPSFTKISMTTFYRNDETCPPENVPNFQVLSDMYYSEGTNINKLYSKVLYNIDSYIENTARYPETKIQNEMLVGFKSLLDGNDTEILNQPTHSLYRIISPFYCGGSPAPNSIVFDIDYEGVDSAKGLLHYDSRQFPASSLDMPASFSIISRIGNDYSIIQGPIGKLYEVLIDQNTLASCDEVNEYGSKWIPVGSQCLENIVRTEIDRAKLDVHVNRALETFKLK